MNKPGRKVMNPKRVYGHRQKYQHRLVGAYNRHPTRYSTAALRAMNREDLLAHIRGLYAGNDALISRNKDMVLKLAHFERRLKLMVEQSYRHLVNENKRLRKRERWLTKRLVELEAEHGIPTSEGNTED